MSTKKKKTAAPGVVGRVTTRAWCPQCDHWVQVRVIKLGFADFGICAVDPLHGALIEWKGADE